MSLFKKQGKHARSAEADKAVEETIGADADQADAGQDELAAGGPSGFSETAVLEPVEGAPATDGAAIAGSGGQVEAPAITADGLPVPVTDPGDSADMSGLFVDGDTVKGIESGEDEPGGYVAAFEVPKKKKGKALKVFGITVGVLVGVVAIVYFAGVAAFSNWFLPNTTIDKTDVSLKSSEEVAQMLEESAASYKLDIAGNGFTYRLTAQDVGLSIDSKAIVAAMHEDLDSWKWPLLIFDSKHDEAGRFEVSHDPGKYRDALTKEVEKFNETATAPTNATIEYSEKDNAFVIKPEVAGTQLDPAAVLAAVDKAVEMLADKVDITNEQLLQPQVLSTDAKLKESADLATGMISAQMTLTLAGQQVGAVGSDELAQFVTIDDELQVTLNEETLDAWVNDLAASYDTVGSTRTYTRADGKEITIGGGTYGWEVDTEALRDTLIEGIKAGSQDAIEVPCSRTAVTYGGLGTRDWGNRYIDIDLSEQYVRFYGDDGSIIWESACISGKPDGVHDTSTGVFVINDKRSPSKLIGYENGVKIYESDVSYWMPFDGNAIGLHDANWQPSFGGSMYANGYGSHGCVNLPPSAAAELYNIVDYGDVVVSHW